MKDIMTYNYILRILILRLALAFIGLIVVIISIIRAFNPKQPIQEYIVSVFILISIIIVGRYIDFKTGMSNIKGVKIPRFGLTNKEIVIGEDIIPVELKNTNPYGNSIFDISMESEFSENPTIYIYKTKDKKIIYEYSKTIKNKDRCSLIISMKPGEILNFKLNKIGVIKNLHITEIYSNSKKTFL